MRDREKAELAVAITATHAVREASYDRERQVYRLDVWQAAVQAGIDPELVTIVACLLTSGHSEVHDWAATMAKQYRFETELATNALQAPGRQLTIV
jgi:hypothetical protein